MAHAFSRGPGDTDDAVANLEATDLTQGNVSGDEKQMQERASLSAVHGLGEITHVNKTTNQQHRFDNTPTSPAWLRIGRRLMGLHKTASVISN